MSDKQFRDTSHGSAAWLSPAELKGSELVREEGVPLGIGAVELPLDPMEPDKALAQIRHVSDQHHLVVAGSGGGKFVSSLAPMLFDMLHTRSGSVVVVDPKGEALENIGKIFLSPAADRDLREVFWLDPWNVCGTGQSWRLNFLDQLTPDNPNIVDDARALADAIIIPSGGDSHWDTTARNLLTAMLLYIAVHPEEEGKRHLVRLREIATFTETQWLELAALLENSPLCEGAIKREINAHRAREDRERSSIVSTLARDTTWLDSPQIRRIVVGDNVRSFPVQLRAVAGREVRAEEVELDRPANDGFDLDPVKIALGNALVFVVIPPEYFMTHRSWLRLCITAFAGAFKRNKPANVRSAAKRRHICIDEFANLGKLSAVETAVAVERGYGIQYHLYVQHLGQLENEYGRNWETFVANCAVQGFAINDVKTAEYLSKKCGVTTVETMSASESKSTDSTQPLKVSKTRQQGQGTSSRAMITPDEVMGLHPELQLIFVQNMRPIIALKNDFRTYVTPQIVGRLNDVLALRAQLTHDDEETSSADLIADAALLAKKLEIVRRAPMLAAQVDKSGWEALLQWLQPLAPSAGIGKKAQVSETLNWAAKSIGMELLTVVAGLSLVFTGFLFLVSLGTAKGSFFGAFYHLAGLFLMSALTVILSVVAIVIPVSVPIEPPLAAAVAVLIGLASMIGWVWVWLSQQ